MSAITASAVGNPVVRSADQETLIAAVAVTALQTVYVNTSGQWALGNAGAAGTVRMLYIATKTVSAGQPLTAIRRGVLDGYDLTGLAYGDSLYAADVAGGLDTTAGTVSVVVGKVLPAQGAATGATANKLAKIEIPF